jgi:hypothetical protein
MAQAAEIDVALRPVRAFEGLGVAKCECLLRRWSSKGSPFMKCLPGFGNVFPEAIARAYLAWRTEEK